jgi:hypothetical protein
VEKLQERGIPKSRIVVRLFTGSGDALQTVYLASDSARSSLLRLAHLPRRDMILSEGAKKTPLFWGHGEYDDKVLFEQQFLVSN